METMMALGEFRFSIQTAAYQTLRQNHQYRWESLARLHTRPALQFLGVGEESMELVGTIYPHFQGGLAQIKTLTESASNGDAMTLVDGEGLVWGKWVVRQVSEEHSYFLPSGQPLKMTFTLTLLRYASDDNTSTGT